MCVVHILMKDFKDFNVFWQDYHSLLYILKTSMSFVKTIMSSFTFQKTSMSLECKEDCDSLDKDHEVFEK